MSGIDCDSGIDDPTAWLYPNMLSVIDLLHVLWNGCERACKSNETFKNVMDVLTALVAFTSDSQLMRKFRATCCQGVSGGEKIMRSKADLRVDWRWETMTRALDHQVPVHATLRERFDAQKLASTGGGGI